MATPSRPKLLLVSARFSPDVGGVETHVAEVAPRLSALGFEVTVLTTDRTGDRPADEQIDGVQVIRVPAHPSTRDYYFAPALLGEIRRRPADLMHLQGYHTLVAPMAMAAAAARGLPYVVSFHSGGHPSALRNRVRSLQRLLLRPGFTRARRLIAVSRFELELFRRDLRLAASRFTLVRNGSSLPPPRSSRRTEDAIVVSIGRLEQYKGHRRVVEAWPEVVRAVPGARLRILGAGPDEGPIRDLIATGGAADRITLESIPGDDRQAIADALGEASLVTLLSDYEAHPVAIMEALAVGTPVLVEPDERADRARRGRPRRRPRPGCVDERHRGGDRCRAPDAASRRREPPDLGRLRGPAAGPLWRDPRAAPVRILMLAQWYPPILGGEELHVANLSRELAGRGHEVTVATLRQAGLAEEELDGDVRVVRVAGGLQRIEGLFSDTARRSAAPIPDPILTLAIDRIVRRFHPDVMHAHNWLVHAALPIRAARGIPLVQTLHDFSLVCAQKVLLRNGRACSGPGPIKCLACTAHHYGTIKGPITTVANWADGVAQRRLVDRFIPVSRAVATGTGVTGERHGVIPNFVPDATVAPPEPDIYSAQLPSEPYFVFIGALGRLKGLEVLLRAYRADPSLATMVLIGYRMRETEELLRDLPSNVVVLGEWPHAAVQLAWQRAIAGVLPSICQEACPTVAIEAMRAGRPMVASRLGGIIDLVDDGRTGILVTPEDHADLARGLHELARDPQRATAMGARARERSGEYIASAVVPRIEAAYRSVARTSRAAAT